MTIVLRALPRLVGAAATALVARDLGSDFRTLSTFGAFVLLVACLVAFVYALRRAPRDRVAALLLAGSVAALGVRALRYDPLLRASDEALQAQQTAAAEQAAARTAEGFRLLSREARNAARELARSSAAALATEGSDAQDYVSEAFTALGRYGYPRAHPRGASGATLYDAFRRPLAWGGESMSLYDVLERLNGPPTAQLVIVDRGVYTYLVAIEPVLSRRGFVSVEVPLSARRRLQNRYLEDYDALSAWSGRSVDTEYVESALEADEAATLFDDSGGETSWSGEGPDRRLFFALRDDDGQLLGISSVPVEPNGIARLQASRQAKNAAGVAVLLGVVGALMSLWLGGAPAWATAFALVATRLVIYASDLPIGLGLDLDNPAHYASGTLFALARSPIDFLLTAVTLLGLAALASGAVGATRRAGWLTAAVSSALAILMFVAVNEVILDAWSNSSLPIASVSPVPLDFPRLTVQLGLALFFIAAGLVSTTLFRASDYRPPLGILLDGAVVTILYAILARRGLGEHVLLSIPPFVVARLLSYRYRESLLSQRWTELRPHQRIAASAVLCLAAVVSFYPALARFEDDTVRQFIESTVRPAVLAHGMAPMEEALRTAGAIDRLESEGFLVGLDAEDMAYQVWARTNLVNSSLSSSIEIVDDASRLVSRFSLSFANLDTELAMPSAPDRWVTENESATEPYRPDTLLARKSVAGPNGSPWEVRFRLAADWRNLPFVATPNPYLYLFRSAGVDAPFRFPFRELSLSVFAPDGSSVFRSGGPVLPVEDAVLRRARRASLWQDHTVQGELHRTYFFADSTDQYIFALSYPRTTARTFAAELAAWALLAAALLSLLWLSVLGLGVVGAPAGLSFADVTAGIGTSFSAKLYAAFVLIALVPIASLAILMRGILIQQLERDVEQEGMARAQVVERFVRDFIEYQRVDVEDRGPATVTDAVLEWVGSLAAVDVDLYSGGDLVATSKPELFGSGLLRARAVPSVYRDIVLDHASHAIHREAVGSFEYLVVSVPIRIAPWQEPGILALPLASQKGEIDRRVSTLNQTLLLAALGFAAAAAALAYSLARRIAGPIGTLTDATYRVAEGDLDVSVETDARDEIGGLFASFTRMIADLKRQRADLEQTKKLEAWAEMARQVAHEVKNPLTPIQLATEHMVRVYDDPNVDFDEVLSDCSTTILQQVKSLRQISMEFSTFASPEPPQLTRMDLGDLVHETADAYATAPPQGVRVLVDIAEALPPIDGDRRLLKRTLLNLIENALHALNGTGTVAVHVRTEGDGLEIVVSDTGVGIDPELEARVFEPYFSTRAAGTGLGLAIARKVVEDHGGTIALSSSPGRGTRVTIRLPAAPVPAAPSSPVVTAG